MATLKLEKRGCDYFGQDVAREDGIGNYRVCGEVDDGKGNRVFLEFHRGNVYDFMYRGKPRKKPKLMSAWGLWVNADVKDADGMWHPYRIGRETWHHVTEFPWYGKDYNAKEILDVVNSFCEESYTEVKIVDKL